MRSVDMADDALQRLHGETVEDGEGLTETVGDRDVALDLLRGGRHDAHVDRHALLRADRRRRCAGCGWGGRAAVRRRHATNLVPNNVWKALSTNAGWKR